MDLTKNSGANTYFNRPGADLAAHNAAVRECLILALQTQSMDNPIPGGTRNSLISPAYTGLWRIVGRKRVDADLEDCMVVKGWRVVSIPIEEADAIHKLSQAEQAARIQPWVGAETPPGEIVRRWANDAQDAHTVKFVQVRYNGDSSISLTALPVEPGDAPTEAAVRPVAMQIGPPQVKRLKPSDLETVPGDKGVLIFEMKGGKYQFDSIVTLRRADTDLDGYQQSRGDEVFAYQNWSMHPHGELFAFAVTPGKWRVAGLGGGGAFVDFCLGAPAFEVRAGEIVYAGAFNTSERLGPDLSLDPVRPWLGSEVSLADKIGPAAYVNGLRSTCAGTYIYALEVPGASFVDGYTWGSAATGASATAR